MLFEPTEREGLENLHGTGHILEPFRLCPDDLFAIREGGKPCGQFIPALLAVLRYRDSLLIRGSHVDDTADGAELRGILRGRLLDGPTLAGHPALNESLGEGWQHPRQPFEGRAGWGFAVVAHKEYTFTILLACSACFFLSLSLIYGLPNFIRRKS